MGNSAACWICDDERGNRGEGHKYYEEHFLKDKGKLPDLDQVREEAEKQQLAMQQELLPLGNDPNKADFTKPIDMNEIKAAARASMRGSIRGSIKGEPGLSKRKSQKFQVGFSAEAPEPNTQPVVENKDDFKAQRRRMQSMDLLANQQGHEEMKKQLGAALEWMTDHASEYHTQHTEHKKHLTAEEVWEKLKRGNERFEVGALRRSSFLIRIAMESSGFKRSNLTTGQAPHACVLACADSRLPLSLIFNQGLGDLFEIRVAGNVVGHNELGSMEYAVSRLGCRLIVVLGHEACGAVNASMSYDGPLHPLHDEDTSESDAGNLPHILAKISPACTWAKAKRKQLDDQNDPTNPLFPIKALDLAIRKHVHNMAADILKRSKIVREYVKEHEVKLRMAEYRLSSGRVELISPEGIVEAIDPPSPTTPTAAAAAAAGAASLKSTEARKSIHGAQSTNARSSIIVANNQTNSAAIGGSSSELAVMTPATDATGKPISADAQQDLLSVAVADEVTRRRTVTDAPAHSRKGTHGGTLGRGTHKKQKSTRGNLQGAFDDR